MSARLLRVSLIAAALVALVVPSAAWAARLTTRDRHEITRTVNGFVDHVVLRKQPLAAWNLVTPALRAGSTRAEWRRGDVPALPYPAGTRRLRGWTLVYADPGHVGIDLLVKPKPRLNKKVGPIIFNVDLKRLDGRWRVDTFSPGAFLGPLNGKASVYAAPDAGPASARESALSVRQTPTTTVNKHLGLFILLSLGGALLLIPFGIWSVSRYREHAAEARYGAERRELPPLPTGRREP